MADFDPAELGLRPVTLSQGEEAQLLKQPPGQPGVPEATVEAAGLRPMPMEKLSDEELFNFAVESRGKFDPVSYFYANRDRLYADPANVAKFAEAQDRLEKRGFEVSDLPVAAQMKEAAEALAEGDVAEVFKQAGVATKEVALPVWHFFKGVGKQLWNYSNALVGRDPQRRIAENWAGTELAVTGLARQAQQLAGKMVRPFVGERTQEEKIANLWSKVGQIETQEEIAQGRGGFLGAPFVGKYVVEALEEKGKAVRPEEVQALAAGDPLSLWAFGKVFQGVHKATPAALQQAATAAEGVAGKALVTTAGGVTSLAGQAIRGLGVVAKKVAPVAPAVGLAGGFFKGGPIGALAGLKGGEMTKASLARSAVWAQNWGQSLTKFGQDLRTGVPLGSYGQLAKDLLEAAPKFAAETAKGAAIDVALAATTAETPAETAQAATLGTVFGIGRGAYRAGRHLASGQVVVPRVWKPTAVEPASGQFPGIERIHQEAYKTAPPGIQLRINGIRGMLRRLGASNDFFYTPTVETMTRALVELGHTPEKAARYAQTQGMFIDSPRAGGQRVVLVREMDAAPHESFHPIQDVLGETGNRIIDEAVQNSFSSEQWEAYGRDQSARFMGISPEEMAARRIDWREALLDQTGWGEHAAAEKVLRDTAAMMKEPIDSPAVTEAAQDIFSQMVESQGWRQAIPKAVRRDMADQYIARELAADQWDAVLNNLGPSLRSNALPAIMGRAVSGLLSAVGWDPLAERKGVEGVPLKYPVIEAVTKAARRLEPERPAVLPSEERLPGGGGVPRPSRGGEPMTEEQLQQAAREARAIAATTPDQPLPGQMQSQREMLGAVAEGIASRTAVMADYRSAQGLPAGDPQAQFLTRRAEIETARNMPEDQRALMRKLFFPYRVEQRGGGKIQVLGYSPEVVASNAIRWSKALSALAVKDPANPELVKVPYELDLQAGEFTPKGWTDFVSDLQVYAANQLAGFTGAGGRLAVPEALRVSGFFAPPETGAPMALDVERMNFLNLVHGQKPPVSPRIQKGRIPGAIVSEEVSAATMPGRVVTPALVEPKRPSTLGGIRRPFEGPEAERLGVAGRSIMEVNPMRAALEKAMQAQKVPIPQTIEAMQRLNLEHFASAAPEPLQPRTVGANILAQRAGFKPAKPAIRPEEVERMEPEEFREWAKTLEGGITGEAVRLGVALGPEAADQLSKLHQAAAEQSKQFMVAGDFDKAMVTATKSQFFREAREAATDTGSMAAARERGRIQFKPEKREDIRGGSVSAPAPRYVEAAESTGNPWVRATDTPTNEGRTLLIQFASDLINKDAPKDASAAYYDTLYSGKRTGYARLDDFWEIPQWVGFASRFIPNADFYVVRDMAEAKQFLREASYGRIAFSALDVNKNLLREIAKDYPGKIDVGGYVEKGTFTDLPNVKWHESMEAWANDLGVPYKDGVSYQHFQGGKVIPRLTMSQGCKHKCAFCTVVKKLTTTPKEVVDQQADEIAKLGSKLVYLNDKTFGQADNYQTLTDVHARIKEQNPDFSGFIVQTTASQMTKFAPEWLAKSGIKFVELGIETYNDPILKEMHKPATEALINRSVDALRKAGIALIPNIIIGLPGETEGTYARTLDFLKRNDDVISHANIYNLALYKESELGKKIATANEADFNENVMEKSFHTNPETHRVFAGQLYGFAQSLLESKQFKPGEKPLERNVEPIKGMSALWLTGPQRERVQFKPSDDPRAIKAAAIKLPDGEIVTSLTHGLAASEIPPSRWREIVRSDEPYVDGFVDNLGKFLTREEAANRALDLGQITEEIFSEILVEPQLESYAFEATRQFKPPREERAGLAGVQREREIKEFGRPSIPPERTAEERLGIPEGEPPARGGFARQQEIRRRARAEVEPKEGARFMPGSKEEKEEEIRGNFRESALYSLEKADVIEFRHLATATFLPDFHTPAIGPEKSILTLEELRGRDYKSFDREGNRSFHEYGEVLRLKKDESGQYPLSSEGLLRAKKDYDKASTETYEALYSEPEERFKPEKARVEPKGKKQELKLKKAGPDGFSKTWILPNGEVKQLGGQWHHDWLSTNPDVRKQYGLDVEKFKGAEVEGAREQALQKGFVRVNYGVNQGQMTVEARVKDWRKQKDSVFDLIERNLADIDNLRIILYDDRVRKVIDSANEKLFLYDSPEEALANIPFITGREIGVSGERGAQFKPSRAEKRQGPAFFSGSLFFDSDVATVRKGAAGEGQTFNFDGTPWTAPPGDKLDIVTLASVNVPREELTPARIRAALEPYRAQLEAKNVIAGVFNFTDAQGRELTSIDVNVPVPQKHRQNSLEFAKDNDQISIFDAATFKEVKVGGSGDTRLTTPEQIAAAIPLLKQGAPIDVPRILSKRPALAPEEQPARPYDRHKVAGMTPQELRERFPEAVMPRSKGALTPAEITKAPLLKGLKTEEEKVQAFSDKLVAEAEKFQSNPLFEAGTRWYSEFAPALRKEFGDWAPQFAQLLAATSPRTNPELNFRYAYEALRQWQDGAFDSVLRKYREGLDIIKNDQWLDWLLVEHKAGRIETLPAKPSAATFLAEWVNRHDLKPVRAGGLLFGSHGLSILKVLAGIWLYENAGLKTNQFVQNLLGESHGATIDVWANRTMRRLGYEGLADRWRILPKHDAEVPNEDFEFAQKVFARAAEELKMLPDALQGGMWFAEKLHWNQQGWGNLELGTFKGELEKIPKLEKRLQEERKGKPTVEPRALRKPSTKYEETRQLTFRRKI